ncbi:MAG: 2-amino-4-hydroxy-6-hydroxymethyldihydropteridine diphosphokinase [Actinomycetota bacterium]|nr:2-amino-4-hydroxy-6-hydroxymethyldihydropteridine diphosphokinase [Actinomycetota bacterium]
MKFYLGLGSNLGNRAANLRFAITSLEGRGVRIVKASSLYETDPVGGPPDQPPYFNQVIEIDSAFSARELLDVAHEIESHVGRDRSVEERWGPRVIDIDILIGDEAVNDPDLRVPHLRMSERDFVLIPLAEIAPDLVIGDERLIALRSRRSGHGVRLVTH